jgi:hypothetical protein
MDLLLSICLAAAAFAVVVIEFYLKNNETRRKQFLIFTGAFILIITCLKSCREHDANVVSSKQSDSIRNSLDTIKKYQQKTAETLVQVDTLSNYIKRVNNLGIQRDTVTNKPIITQTLYTNINSQANVTSHNQKGGQTAVEITNN